MVLVALSAPTLILGGCGGGPSTVNSPATLQLQGMVHGGQQAVTGSTIQLYAVGATGYGSAATAMLTSTVTTTAGGAFTFTGHYTCPTASTQVYMTATGGNPGLAPGTNNTALTMMAALGNCSNLSSTFVFINELTTVASVYALAPFMATGGGTKLGASSSNTQGLANAFATVNNLVNVSKGTTPGPNQPAGSTIPTDELNTLADMVGTCVNSNGTSGECSTLFADAKPTGGVAPTNTIDALLDIVQNPGNNVDALFNLVNGTSPFQPILTDSPNDWTMDVNYTGGGLNTPYFLAIDATGNVWVSNDGNNSVSKLSGTGSAISGASGYTAGGVNGPWGIAIDPSGNVWVADATTNALTELSSTGGAVGSSPFAAGGISDPFGIAINGSGTVWTANLGNVSAIVSSGAAQSGSPYTVGGVNNCYDIAIDGSGNTWITDNSPYNRVSELSSSGAAISSSSGYTGAGISAPWGIAIDSSGHVWIANNGTSTVSELNSSGGAISSTSGYTGGGLNSPEGLAVDGLGNVWVANSGNDSVTELKNSGTAISPSTGYLGGGMSGPTAVAVDGSGNVWVSNGGSTSVTEIVGAAAPVVTPLSVAAKNNTIAIRP
jgi:streptogramin lyase